MYPLTLATLTLSQALKQTITLTITHTLILTITLSLTIKLTASLLTVSTEHCKLLLDRSSKFIASGQQFIIRHL